MIASDLQVHHLNQEHIFALRASIKPSVSLDLGIAEVKIGEHPTIGQCILISTVEGTGKLLTQTPHKDFVSRCLAKIAPVISPL